MENIRRKYNITIDLSKFISNKKILTKIVTLYYNFFLKKKLKKKKKKKKKKEAYTVYKEHLSYSFPGIFGVSRPSNVFISLMNRSFELNGTGLT